MLAEAGGKGSLAFCRPVWGWGSRLLVAEFLDAPAGSPSSIGADGDSPQLQRVQGVRPG